MQCLLLLACTLAVTAAEPPAAPAQPLAPTPALFREDARLRARVTIAEKDRPLGSLLPQLGRQLGVRLNAAPKTADDKVTLFLDERPAAEVLALVAGHFEFRWYRSGGGYQLGQPAERVRREQALRDGELAAQLVRIQTRMHLVSRLANSSREQLEQRSGELDRRLSDRDVPGDERARLREERAALDDLLRPGARAAVAVYRLLNAGQFALLRSGGEIRLASADGSLPALVTGEIQQASAAPSGSRQVVRIGGAPGAAPPPDDAPPTGAEAVIRVTDFPTIPAFRGGPQVRGERRIQLEFIMSSLSGGEMGARKLVPVTWTPDVSPLRQEAISPVTGDDPALAKRMTLDLQRAAPGAAAPPGQLPALPVGTGAWTAGMITLGDVAEALHRTAGLEVVADSFIRARLAGSALAPFRAAPHPLGEVLAAVADPLRYGWRKEGNLLRFRDATFYNDRPLEVPDRVVRPWREQVAATGAPDLDDLASLAAALDDAQCRGMHEYWGWYLEDPKSGAFPSPPGMGPAGFYQSRHHLRFWAALSPAARRSALAGEAVPVSQLNVPQRQAFRTALASPAGSPFLPGPAASGRPPTEAAIAGGGFRLNACEYQQQIFAGTGPNGERNAAVILGPRGDGGAPPRLNGPEGINLEPAGAPTLLDGYTFAYYLAAQQTPVRTTNLNVPRPPTRSR